MTAELNNTKNLYEALTKSRINRHKKNQQKIHSDNEEYKQYVPKIDKWMRDMETNEIKRINKLRQDFKASVNYVLDRWLKLNLNLALDHLIFGKVEENRWRLGKRIFILNNVKDFTESKNRMHKRMQNNPTPFTVYLSKLERLNEKSVERLVLGTPTVMVEAKDDDYEFVTDELDSSARAHNDDGIL